MQKGPVPIPVPQARYKNLAYGSWGQFGTTQDENQVIYFSAHVQLAPGEDPEGIGLVESIAPVREVLDTKRLAFSELLQRDLEDHRVLTGLIPYLMEHDERADGRISFFPPLLAVMLPFDGDKPSSFPALEERIEKDEESGIWSVVIEAPNFFCLKRTAFGSSGKLVRTQRTAEIKWNPTKSRLVVIDGQHRAMALLAIYRTLSKSGARWSGPAARYKSFYEEEITKLYGERELPQIEVPVTICVFPGLIGKQGDIIHKAARRLFVDVNKEAKTPNKSRIILLSETNLIHMFTRSLLDELRVQAIDNKADLLPLAAVEFDTPSSQKAMNQQRTICVTNIEQLSEIVKLMVMCRRQMEDFGVVVKRMNIGQEESLRNQLGLVGNDPEAVDELTGPDGEHEKSTEIESEIFPAWAYDDLKDRFLRRHGRPLIRIFSEVAPYSIFKNSVHQFEEDWVVIEDEAQALSKEALFDGVGTYWTLRDFDTRWKEVRSDAPVVVQRQMDSNPPGSVKAWRIVKSKEQGFQRCLSNNILLSVGIDPASVSDEVEAARLDQVLSGNQSIIERARTLAVQAGLASTFAGLVIDFEVPPSAIDQFTTGFIDQMNSAISSRSSCGLHRMFMFSNHHPFGGDFEKFYLFSKNLEPVRFGQMRWIWLEIFFARTDLPSEELMKVVDLDVFNKRKKNILSRVRKVFFKTLIEEAIAKFPEATDSEKDAERARMEKRITSAYKSWLDEDVSSYFSNTDTDLMLTEPSDAIDEDTEFEDS